jgi:hypothetical protein
LPDGTFWIFGVPADAILRYACSNPEATIIAVSQTNDSLAGPVDQINDWGLFQHFCMSSGDAFGRHFRGKIPRTNFYSECLEAIVEAL